MSQTAIFFSIVVAAACTIACSSKSSSTQDTAEISDDASTKKTAPPPPTVLDIHGDALPRHALVRLGSVRMRDRTIANLVVAPSGAELVSASRDAYLIWDAKTGKRLRRLERMDANYPVAISPDSKLMATGVIGTGEIQLWDFAGRSMRKVIGAGDKEVTAMCFLSRNRLAAATEDGTIRIWAVGDGGNKADALTGDWTAVTAVGCSQEDMIVAWGDEEGSVYSISVGKGEPVKHGAAADSIVSIAVSPDGSVVAAGAKDERLHIWSRTSANKQSVQAHDSEVSSVSFSGDGKQIFTAGGDSWFRVWDPKNGELIRELTGIESLERQILTVVPNDVYMVSWSKRAGRWWLWTAADGEMKQEPHRHAEAVNAVAFSPDGKQIITGSGDMSIRIWETATGKALDVLPAHDGAVNHVAFNNKAEIVSAGRDASLHIWNRGSEKERRPIKGIGGEVSSFALSVDGKRIATSDEVGKVWTWSANGERLVAHDGGKFRAVNQVAISPDGSRLAIAGSDKPILITNTDSGDLVQTLNPPVVSNYGVDFSSDGKLLATAGDDHVVRLWSTADWSQSKAFTGHDGTVQSVAFSPDGKRVASGSSDFTVRIWDVASGETVAILEGHEGAVMSVAFSPDGKLVASASRDHTALIWKIP